MSAAFGARIGLGIARPLPPHAEPRPRVIANYLAPLLSGFAVGAGLGVLLWYLF
jgi:hypothetical protein